jgi:myo-inositol-1-phosphate synthase
LTGPASYFMKSPPVQYDDHEAMQRTRDFIDDIPYTGRGRDA